MEMAIRVLIVAVGHYLVERLEACSERIPRVEAAVRVVETSSVVEMAGEWKPDVVILDHSVKNSRLFEVIGGILALAPEAKVLSCQEVLDHRSIVKALRAGASGCLPQDPTAEELHDSIQAVTSNRLYISPRSTSSTPNHVDRDLRTAGATSEGSTAGHLDLVSRPPRILLIDDNETIAKVGVDILEHLGYAATSQTDAVLALDKLRSGEWTCDLLIVDHALQGVSGREVAATVHLEMPSIPIILVSGSLLKLSAEEKERSGICQVLQKPFTVDDLGSCVRAVLARPLRSTDQLPDRSITDSTG
jgi:CheY-like chemotaxis protein